MWYLIVSIPDLCNLITFKFLESHQPTKKSPEYWHNLGSSKSRNAQQEKLSREIIEDLIGNCDAETAVGFTDGSCLLVEPEHAYSYLEL